MKDLITPLFDLSESCIRLSEELQISFKREREALMSFKTEDLLENNLAKERLIGELVKTRNELRQHIATHFSDGDPSNWLLEPELGAWNAIKLSWDFSWQRLRDRCVNNQDFLKHSLRNLDMLHENISRLFGIHTVYSAKGTRVERKPHGNVVQGRY